MTEMVEKVARQICEECFPGAAPWELQSKDSVVRRQCFQAARAAISALMEPTGKMVETGEKTRAGGSGSLEIFYAMLKAALND